MAPDRPGLDTQVSISYGAQFMVPLFGASANAVLGLNLNGLSSAPFFQLQGNGGIGGGIFGGFGGAVGPSSGDAPVTGFDSSNYAEIDGGWGPALTLSTTLDENGNMTSKSLGYPYRVGAGYGLGGFLGKQFTGTVVGPSLQTIINILAKLVGC